MSQGRSVFLFVAGALVSVALAAPARAGGSSANECVNVRSAELSTGLAFDVENACEKRLSCALSWSLTCSNASGRTTSKTKQEARFLLGASDTQHTLGSSAACKDSWAIDDVAWSCAPTN
jgi:hypothetical protein